MPGVQARHEAASRWSTNRASRIEIREAHSLGRELVDVRRFDSLLAVATEIAVTQIVGEDEDDIGCQVC